MATLSAAQIAGVIKHYANPTSRNPARTPITDNNAVIAIAIALAESGGNASAVNNANSNGSSDYGLWQINSIHNPSDREKFSPDANWLLAWRIAAMGTSWSPWVTYKNGKYRDFMNTARGAWANPDESIADPTGTGADWEEATDYGSSGSGKAPVIPNLPPGFEWLEPLFSPSFWVRIGMGLGGILLIALVVGSFVKGVTPIGRIMELAKGAKA